MTSEIGPATLLERKVEALELFGLGDEYAHELEGVTKQEVGQSAKRLAARLSQERASDDPGELALEFGRRNSYQ